MEVTVDTIHVRAFGEGLELVALVMKSEVLMGQKWGEGFKGPFVPMRAEHLCVWFALVLLQFNGSSINTSDDDNINAPLGEIQSGSI